ncbi:MULTISPECIES: ATP-binding cassette domain-containing protein [Bradyrhizobium]|uniref:ATP-binding cassette domain-containing protein n=1 Tax=Bradyrhizobium TaxID=374 RepID=UPI00117F32B0|nr:ATP-binding cassette domain-containing protein [Bradyrhizobium japonicum]
MADLQESCRVTLSISNLRKSFGDFPFPKGINLSAREGEVMSVLGSSGSGKSMMLRCISMLARGVRPKNHHQVDGFRSSVAMVFQSAPRATDTRTQSSRCTRHPHDLDHKEIQCQFSIVSQTCILTSRPGVETFTPIPSWAMTFSVLRPS